MIFQKIARLLKSEINGNSWHVGDLLPSEAELAVRYNVSRNTLRKALSLLEGEGIITSVQANGEPFVQFSHVFQSAVALPVFQVVTNG